VSSADAKPVREESRLDRVADAIPLARRSVRPSRLMSRLANRADIPEANGLGAADCERVGRASAATNERALIGWCPLDIPPLVAELRFGRRGRIHTSLTASTPESPVAADHHTGGPRPPGCRRLRIEALQRGVAEGARNQDQRWRRKPPRRNHLLWSGGMGRRARLTDPSSSCRP